MEQQARRQALEAAYDLGDEVDEFGDGRGFTEEPDEVVATGVLGAAAQVTAAETPDTVEVRATLGQTRVVGGGSVRANAAEPLPFALYDIAGAAANARTTLERLDPLDEAGAWLSEVSSPNNSAPSFLLDNRSWESLVADFGIVERVVDQSPPQPSIIEAALERIRSAYAHLKEWIGPAAVKFGEKFMDGFASKLGERSAELLTSKTFIFGLILQFTGQTERLIGIVETGVKGLFGG